MGWPEANEGVGGLSFDEHDLMQSQTDLHAKTLLETSLRHGKTASYIIPPGDLDGNGPYEIRIPSMDSEWTDLTSGVMYGKFQVKKVSSGSEAVCTTEDYSVVNLPVNSLFKQIELYVGNTNVVDQSTSTYHYKRFISLFHLSIDIKFIISFLINIV